MKTRQNLEKRKIVFDKGFELHNKLLNIYKTQYVKLSKPRDKKIKVQNLPENVSIGLYLDEDDEEVKLEPEETIAESVKLNPPKRKNEGTG